MEGGLQNFLQLFVAYGYWVSEHDICVDLPDVLEGKLDYANASLSEIFARARCSFVLAPFGVATIKVYS